MASTTHVNKSVWIISSYGYFSAVLYAALEWLVASAAFRVDTVSRMAAAGPTFEKDRSVAKCSPMES